MVLAEVLEDVDEFIGCAASTKNYEVFLRRHLWGGSVDGITTGPRTIYRWWMQETIFLPNGYQGEYIREGAP